MATEAFMAVEVRNGLAVVAVSVMVIHLLKFLRNAVWEPLRLRRIMAKQGVRGPPFRFLLGHMVDAAKFSQTSPDSLPVDDYANLSPTVTPQYALFFPKYGKIFVYCWGTMTRLVVRDPEIVKELMITNHEALRRSEFTNKTFSQVMGKGVLTSLGKKWITERRILNPFFHQDALKDMAAAMVKGAATEIELWEQMVAEGGGEAEIDMEPHLHKISGRIISQTAFGEDFEKGEQIFKFQTLLGEHLVKSLSNSAYWLVPGYRLIPTKENRLMRSYRSKMGALLHSIIDGRREAVRNGEVSSNGHDLLGRMLTAASEGWDESSQEFNLAAVFNNCKLFYFAGQDTVANATNFALLMLALYPDWQDRARTEVMEVLGSDREQTTCTASAMSRLKVVGMIFNETLRLFPPATAVTRSLCKDVQLKGLFLPKGIIIELALSAIHQDREYWGDDVGEFNPGRFAGGVSEACSHRQAFNPFGLGPKFCIGNNFAVMEAKIVLAMVLRQFRILPSPNYKHHPVAVMVQRPKFGLPIILKAL